MAEWVYLKVQVEQTRLSDSGVFISGQTSVSAGKWLYDNGMTFYDTSKDQCFGYCEWKDTANLAAFNNQYLVARGGNTAGGQLTLYNVPPIADLTGVDVTLRDDTMIAFSCAVIASNTRQPSDPITCSVPQGFGEMSYLPPTIDSIQTSIGANFGQVFVTIYGANFGTVMTEVTVSFGPAENSIICSLTLVIHTQIQCTIANSPVVLPVTIKVNTLSTITYRAPIWALLLARQRKVNGLAGQIAYVLDQNHKNWLSSTILPSATYTFSVGLDKFDDNKCVLTGEGFNNGTTIANPYGWSANSGPGPYMYSFSGGLQTRTTTFDNVIIEYQSSSGLLTLYYSNLGLVDSNIKVVFGAQDMPIFQKDYTLNMVTIVYPPGISDKDLTMSFDPTHSTIVTEMYYGAPNITSITSPPTVGGVITVQGTNFYNDSSLLKLSFKHLSSGANSICTNVQYLVAHYNFTCVIVKEIGKFTADITINGNSQPSSLFTQQYIAPTITSVTFPGTTGLNITGINFGNGTMTLYRSVIDGMGVAGIQIIEVDQTYMYITVPSNTRGPNFSVRIFVGGTPSNLYPPLPITIDTITYDLNSNNWTITGTGYTNVLYSIQIGDITINTAVQFISATQLQFISPDGLASGNLTLTDVNNPSVTITHVMFLTPIITSVQDMVPVIGGLVTVKGKYFEQLVLGRESNFKVLVNGSQASSYTYVSLSEVIFTCEPGYGDVTLQVMCGTQDLAINPLRPSNIVMMNYEPPRITGATEVSKATGGNVTITGSGFVNTDHLSASIGGVTCTHLFFISNTMLICDFDASVSVPPNGQSIPVKVIVGTGRNQAEAYLFYYTVVRPCPNACSGQGACDDKTGLCTCTSTWGGLNCAIALPPNRTSVDPPQPNTSGGTDLPAGGINFSIAITHLREVTPSLETVRTLPMRTIVWTNFTTTPPHYEYAGGFPNNGPRINLSLTVYKEATTIQFANAPMNIAANSVKYLVGIDNYQFNSSLNILQVIYTVHTPRITEFNCASSHATTQGEDTTNFYYVQVGGSTMQSKYSERLIVDQRVATSKISEIKSSDEIYNSEASKDPEIFTVMTAINVPHFLESCQLDPNFGALVQPSSDAQCDTKDEKYKIPVIETIEYTSTQ
eukprot:gene18143-21694_t